MKYALDLINHLQAENEARQAHIDLLQAENSNLTSDLASLQNDLTSTKAEYEDLQQQFRYLDIECERLEKENESQNAEIERLQKENKQFAYIGKMYSEIKSEAIKEFWNCRPPRLNEKCVENEEYNKGWNACLDEFWEIRNNLVKERVGDTG